VDNVHIGLTSSNGVTFAQDANGSGSACQPTCWFDLSTIRPTHRARPLRPDVQVHAAHGLYRHGGLQAAGAETGRGDA